VPFTCKELIGAKGLNFSTGLVARKGLKAEEDAEVIELMRESGAILLCVTITSELGLWFESSNRVYGRCKNPYDPSRIVSCLFENE
jgi:fatty acid amide hydrolase 2